MPLPNRITTLAPLALTTVVVAACGGSSGSASGVSPSAYVKSVCTSVGPFEKDVVSRSSALDLTTIKNAAQGKTALKGFLSAVAADTHRAYAALQAAGVPSVKNGKSIAGAIVGAFGQLDGTMTTAVKQADSIPTNSPAAFKTAAQNLGTTVRTSMAKIGTNLQTSTLKSPALEQAAAKETACKTLGS
jgi:hypothetical protein